ncbi:mitotic spindle assembly checkpoint protein MAD2B isoform X1 [Hippoglossus hippoglossus]|uniref:mitotic spindle assembly checkpoint protein MAD2B isoform X1 n=1 Tax=Hippoglossus hippoglossus TaxID=8267 RepID=UPI00148D39E3|nr:mitotic spindle assembly checkpoint protein MAD2B isoform X1 [Hippoglossus hippoglossus]
MTTLTRQDLNFGQVVADILCEFLEVAIHLILYVREVYPSGIFQKRKKYNVPVQMSCHPELNQYIQDTLHCVKPLIEKNDAEKVVVVIMDKEHHPVERFVFEISQPTLLSISSDTLLSHVEQLLRAFILKISVCDAVLNNNPPGKSIIHLEIHCKHTLLNIYKRFCLTDDAFDLFVKYFLFYSLTSSPHEIIHWCTCLSVTKQPAACALTAYESSARETYSSVCLRQGDRIWV